MKKLFFIFLVSMVTMPISYASVIKVCNSCNYKDVTTALNMSHPYDTIIISGGTYEVENLVIRYPLVIFGEKEATIKSKSGDEVFTVLADSTTISGLTIRDVTTSYMKERSGIRIKKAKYFKISNNILIDCFFAIYIEHGAHGSIRNNELRGNATTDAESGNGIHAWYSDFLEITDNTVMGHRDGIYFEFVNDSKIINNHSERNKRYGLHFMFSNDDSYQDNTFRNNGVGVAVMFSRRIEMKRNTFEKNWGRSSYGLLLKEIYDAEILHNKFKENTIGIFVEGSNRINYHFNDFNRNGWALKFSGGCEDNDISQNNFIDNSLDLVVNTKLSSNKFHNNYWSEYSGYDLDRDQVGDVPHYPVKLFSYVLDKAPEAIVLMRSLFVDVINFSEKISPVFTPKDVMDDSPLMFPIND